VVETSTHDPTFKGLSPPLLELGERKWRKEYFNKRLFLHDFFQVDACCRSGMFLSVTRRCVSFRPCAQMSSSATARHDHHLCLQTKCCQTWSTIRVRLQSINKHCHCCERNSTKSRENILRHDTQQNDTRHGGKIATPVTALMLQRIPPFLLPC